MTCERRVTRRSQGREETERRGRLRRARSTERARGEKELSTRMVAKAYDQAVKADAWQAADYLRGVQLLIILADSPEKAPAFWKRHATVIRRMARSVFPNPVDSMALHLSVIARQTAGRHAIRQIRPIDV